MDSCIGASAEDASLLFLKTSQISLEQVEVDAALVLAGFDGEPVELSVYFCGSSAMQELNALYRDKDEPTDVLAFSQREQQAGDDFVQEGECPALGDVVICTEVLAKQAEDAGITLREELRRLLIHGILHLLGYEHVHGGDDEQEMRSLEAQILKTLEDGSAE